MPFTTAQSIQFIDADQQILNQLIRALFRQKVRHRQATQDILEQIIIGSLADQQGYLRPNALTDEQIGTLESELINLYSAEAVDNNIAEAIGAVNQRLTSIDDIMIALEVDEAILGSEVFEMQVVQEAVGDMAEQYAVGAYGSDQYEGSVSRIRDSMNRYRLDKSKSEFTLRSELMETLAVDSNAGVNFANSHAVTAMASIDRELKRVQAAQAGIETGLYAGPLDDLTRPFCDEWVGYIMEYEFWDTLSNDMPEGLYDTPVSFYCGGINCRHRIIPYRLSWSDGNRDLRSQF